MNRAESDLLTFVAAALLAGCGASARPEPAAATLVHLDREIERARVQSASPPASARSERSWNFAESPSDWHPISPEGHRGFGVVELQPIPDGVKMSLSQPENGRQRMILGGITVDVPESPVGAWTGLVVRARSHARMAGIAAACGVEGGESPLGPFSFFGMDDQTSPVFNDGSVQSYQVPLVGQEGATTVKSVAILAAAPQPASLEILSVALVPRGAAYVENHGVASVTRDTITRRTIYAHAPASLAFKVRVPEGGRLDVGLACLAGDTVDYRASVVRGKSDPEVLGSESVADASTWKQRSFDLSGFAGEEVQLVLEASSSNEGAVAFWGAPIVSGARPAAGSPARRPNVLFYVIDGGGADLMSLYGYNRRTTPFLERLAQEGVVFEHAHSNSTWTQPSTASFMTSLQHSVLGGLRRGIHSTPVPARATTMAEHMHGGGYQTAVFTSNPNCARIIGLQRGVDVMRDVDAEDASNSSPELHDRFWAFRRDYPGRPYWVHFQTTDVHEPNEPPPPFAGLFVSPEERERLERWEGELFQKAGDLFGTTSIIDFYDRALERAKIDRRSFFNARRGLYDETMAHQDRELERFVERLKAEGEWEDTLLVIASDHGHPAGTFARWGRGLIEPQPEGWQGALFDSYSTRVPLIFVWPRGIEGGRRIHQPVSMIDVLPTILELAGLPQPEVLQGRSLAPLLRGGELAPRPVILDEFRVDEATGAMAGNIEMIDGRWGASLEIGPPAASETAHGRHAFPAGGRWGAVHPFFPSASRLLLYDLWNDPFATRAVNDENPELVERYEKTLLAQWEAHQALATRFGEAGDEPLDPELVKKLQSLGYTR